MKEAMMQQKSTTGRGGARPNTGGAREKAGRKKLEYPQQKKKTVSITVASDDLAMIDTAAKREGLSRSAYLVRCALEKELMQ